MIKNDKDYKKGGGLTTNPLNSSPIPNSRQVNVKEYSP